MIVSVIGVMTRSLFLFLFRCLGGQDGLIDEKYMCEARGQEGNNDTVQECDKVSQVKLVKHLP